MLPVPVSESLSRFTGSRLNLPLAFESFVAVLETVYAVSLTRPQLVEPEQIGKFCTGLIEGEKTHPWRAECSRLSARSRLGIAHSLFLFRKVIPKKKPLVKPYVDLLGTPQPPPDPDFLRFAEAQVRKLFPLGWDRKYQDYCLTSSLPMTSSSEYSRMEGGSRGWLADSRMLRKEFCEYVLKAVVPRTRGVSRVQAIETGGKWRTVSIPPFVDNCLRPLHKAMYSHLSHFDWLLRGDAKPNRFKDFVPVEGEVFVSGDYESATDNLNSALQEAIFRVLLERSYTVPQGIREHALSIYRSFLVCDGVPEPGVQMARGQLMGQLTSFPLLCLVNYITFRYGVRRHVPVRINGDDIVFRATPAEATRWEDCVAKGGLKLSKGKTLIHSRGFTLNSTPFWAARSGAISVGFVRPRAAIPGGLHSERVASLNGRFYSVAAGYSRRRLRVVRTWFLALNQTTIHLTRRSVSRGLGLAVDQEMLRSVGLWHRELFYLEQAVERPLPYLKSGSVPDGWRQVSAHWLTPEVIQRQKLLWSEACIDHAWVADFSPCEFSEDTLIGRIREGVSPYGLGSLIGSKVRRMLKLSRKLAWKWVNLRSNESVFGRVRWGRGVGVWLEVDLLASRSQVEFICSSCPMS